MKLTGRILCASLLTAAFSTSWAYFTMSAVPPKPSTNQAIAAPINRPAPALNAQNAPAPRQQSNTVAKQDSATQNSTVAENATNQNNANNTALSAKDSNAKKSS